MYWAQFWPYITDFIGVRYHIILSVKLLHKPIDELLKKKHRFSWGRYKKCRRKSIITFSIFSVHCMVQTFYWNVLVLQTGADVNLNTTCKDSPLHLASFCCATQNVSNGFGVITSLLEAGTLQLALFTVCR